MRAGHPLRHRVDRSVAAGGNDDHVAAGARLASETRRIGGIARLDELRSITTRQLRYDRLAPRPRAGEARAGVDEDQRTTAPGGSRHGATNLSGERPRS